MSTESAQYLVRRWWWKRFSPIVRVGWIVTKSNGSGEAVQTGIGLGLIALGLLVKKRKRTVLYRTTVPTDGAVKVKVVRRGRVVASS